MSFEELHIIIIVHWYIHRIATIQTERPTPLGLIEDICPHHFSGAMFNSNFSSVHLILDEKILRFYMLGAFGAKQDTIYFQAHGRHIVLVHNVLVN